MRRARFLIVAVAAVLLLASAAFAKTPVPTKAQGTGHEPMSGGGVMPGGSFKPHYAIALLDISFHQIEVYLLPKKTACNAVLFANPPYVVVTVDTHGAPLIVGRPSLQNGRAFVQVDFHPAKIDKYFSIQPGASITFTHVDPARNSTWHGRLTVKRQRFEGHVFSYKGTFAAHWCGKD